MDAVELAIPAAVAVSKLMGSEGFRGGGGGGGIGVSVIEAEICDADGVSISVGSPIDGCSSFLGRKDETATLDPAESYFWDKTPDGELCKHASDLSNLHYEDASEDLKVGSKSSSPLFEPRIEGKQVQRRSSKVSRSNSTSAKRSRIARMEVFINEAGPCDTKEKTQMAKQKSGLSAKRCDKRNGKIPIRSKSESFSLKAGLGSFNSAAGGNNFLGLYGLKPDVHDVTKDIDEHSVDELLDGSYKCPTFSKPKGRKAADSDESILHSVREAFSILRLQKPVKSQSSAEVNSSCNQKVLTCPLNSGACPSGRCEHDGGNTCVMDISSCNKVQDHDGKARIPYCFLDSPKNVLERLSLPPPQELESLLIDMAKPSGSLKSNTDPRGKPISQRAGLPPFPWSHVTSAHGKSSDGIKPSLSRSTCHGRWMRMGKTANLEATPGFLKDFESLTFDHNLVPLVGTQLGPLENENTPSTSVNFLLHQQGSLSCAARSMAFQVPPESGRSPKSETGAGLSPSLLAAAQTLCDIAAHSMKQYPNGMMRWRKSSLERTMKACKSKMNEKSAAPMLIATLGNPGKITDETSPSKKPKLCKKENNRDPGQGSSTIKGAISWSIPRSSRSAPVNSFKDPFSETKCNNGSGVKQPYRLPPPSRMILDKACSSQQKTRKPVSMEWNREGSKLG